VSFLHNQIYFSFFIHNQIPITASRCTQENKNQTGLDKKVDRSTLSHQKAKTAKESFYHRLEKLLFTKGMLLPQQGKA